MTRRWLSWMAVAALLVACGVDAVGSSDGADTQADVDASSGGVGGSSGATSSSSTSGDPGGNVNLDGAASDGEPDVDSAPPKDANVPDVMVDANPDAPPPLTYVCPGKSNVTDCAMCPGRPLNCYMCATGGGAGYHARCVADNGVCKDETPAGYDWCKCSNGDPKTCVLPNQGCNPYQGGVCVTCGENATQGDSCKGGGKCNRPQHTCM